MELPVLIALAAVAALVTLLVCDLAGSIARAKGRSYWGFFAFGLLLWFPALITALALSPRGELSPAPARAPGRPETAVAGLLVLLAVLALAAAAAAVVSYAP